MEPYLHQLQSLMWSIPLKDPAFFMQMGTGKTKSSIEWVRWNDIDRNILVVTVNQPLAENWVNEFNMNYPALEGTVLMGKADERKLLLSKEFNFFVINYEGLKVIWDDLYSREWDAIILDESRRIMNPKSTRTQLCVELGKKAQYRTILSGLPTVNPIDIYGQYLFLDKGETFGKNFYKFRRTYFNEIKKGRFVDWRIKKDKEPELYEAINNKCFRIKKSECLDLPDKIYKKLFINLSSDQYKDYMTLVEGDGNLSITSLDRNELENCFMKYSQITGGFVKDLSGDYHYYKDNPKLSTMLDLIQDAIQDTKVMIFHRFIAEGRLIEEFLKKHGFKFASMRSEIKDCSGEAKKFQEDDNIRILVAHPLSGGIGLNFTQSSCVIYYSMDWNLEYKLQSEDRSHRIGQTKNVEYIHLLAKNTIEEEIWKSHQENIDIIKRMTKYKLSLKEVLLGKGISWKEDF